MNPNRRVVVTGMGVVSPFGMGKEKFWSALKAGKSGIRRVQRINTDDIDAKVAAEVLDFTPEPYIPLRESAQMDRFCQFGVWACGEALEDSGLDLSKEDPYRIGSVLGSGIGGLDYYEHQAGVLHLKGARRVNPFFIPKVIINILAGWLGILKGIKGYSNGVVTACSTSLTAIGEAYLLIKADMADVMVAGGAEAAITRMGMAGFASMKALSTKFNDTPEKASRPFDAKRDGFVMGDGAGVLVLEELGHAERRNARIYAEIVGYALTSDAYHITAPDPCGKGASAAMSACLQSAKILPQEVEYINAHGTSTPYNDRTETLAIKEIFGDYAYKVPISSTKSMHGHLLGAAGGVESVATILTMRDGIIPPTINQEVPDPECDLDYVPNVARQKNVSIAMNNSFAFGGHNAILLFKKYDQKKGV
ncbi:MAG: beta-ketoacyl-ACP synthase II [bacterium JZ-2024 1]